MDVVDLRQALRAATEDDVEAALEATAISGEIQTVDAPALLEFFNRMLDVLLAEEE